MTVSANSIIGSVVLLLTVFAVAVFLLSGDRFSPALAQKHVLFLCAVALLYAAAAVAMTQTLGRGGLPVSVYLPTATVAMLVALIISPGAGIAFTLCCSATLMVVAPMDLYAFFFAFASGMAGVSAVSRTQTRIDLVRAGLTLSLLNLPVLFGIGFMSNAESPWFLNAAVAAVGNGFFCGILALGFLPILDHVLNTATRFRLMELSDLNSPILKRMLAMAPGTYSHSINVANLAESACTEIGCNYLLARVGAYYHDIGKIDQAEYFVENQTAENKHDELKPSLSAAVIKSHVKIGVERAKELSLPPEVVDIIAQHHGRDVIKYFYHRAKEDEGASQVSAGDFSYRGARPMSKEAAIVMLADATEAATRTLRRPTVGRLEKTIWSIITDRFSSLELSDSSLTFRDLEIIKRSFVRVLAGQFHTRIEYPKPVEAGP